MLKRLEWPPNIEEHDLNVKAKRAIEFLNNGDKVKVSVRFRGREMGGHTDAGRKVLLEFAEIISEHGIIDKNLRWKVGTWLCI